MCRHTLCRVERVGQVVLGKPTPFADNTFRHISGFTEIDFVTFLFAANTFGKVYGSRKQIS